MDKTTFIPAEKQRVDAYEAPSKDSKKITSFAELFSLMVSRGFSPTPKLAQVLLDNGRSRVTKIDTNYNKNAFEVKRKGFFELVFRILRCCSEIFFGKKSSSSQQAAQEPDILWGAAFSPKKDVSARLLYHVLGDTIGAKDKDLVGFAAYNAWDEWIDFFEQASDLVGVDAEFSKQVSICKKQMREGLSFFEKLLMTISLERLGKSLHTILDQLSPGESFIFHGGWNAQPGHALIYEFVKGQDASSHQLRVHNTGAGSEYHDQTSVDWHVKVGPYTVQGVSIDVLCSKPSLSALKELMIYQPEVSKSAKDIYEGWLPMLGGKKVDPPLYIEGQRSGTCGFASLFAFLQAKLPEKQFFRVSIAFGIQTLAGFRAKTEKDVLLALKCHRALSQQLIEAEHAGVLTLEELTFIQKKLALTKQKIVAKKKEFHSYLLSSNKISSKEDLTCKIKVSSTDFPKIQYPSQVSLKGLISIIAKLFECFVPSKKRDDSHAMTKEIHGVVYQAVPKEQVSQENIPLYIRQNGTFWWNNTKKIFHIEMPDGAIYEAHSSLFKTTIYICDKQGVRTNERLLPESSLPEYLQSFEEKGYILASTVDGKNVSHLSFPRIGNPGLSFSFDMHHGVFRRDGSIHEILLPDQYSPLFDTSHKLLLRNERTKESYFLIPGHFLALKENASPTFSTERIPRNCAPKEDQRPFIPLYVCKKEKGDFVPEGSEARAQLAYTLLCEQEYEKASYVLEKMEKTALSMETIKILCWIVESEDTDIRALSLQLKAEALLKRQKILFHQKIPIYRKPSLEEYFAARHRAGTILLSEEEEVLLDLPRPNALSIKQIREKGKSIQKKSENDVDEPVTQQIDIIDLPKIEAEKIGKEQVIPKISFHNDYGKIGLIDIREQLFSEKKDVKENVTQKLLQDRVQSALTEVENRKKEAIARAKTQKRILVRFLAATEDEEVMHILQESLFSAGFVDHPRIHDVCNALIKKFPEGFYSFNPALTFENALKLREAVVAYLAEKTYVRHLSKVEAELRRAYEGEVFSDKEENELYSLMGKVRSYDIAEAPQNLLIEEALSSFLQKDQAEVLATLYDDFFDAKKLFELFPESKRSAFIVPLLTQIITTRGKIPIIIVPENLMDSEGVQIAKTLQKSFSQVTFSWKIAEDAPISLTQLQIIEFELREALRHGGAIMVSIKDIDRILTRFSVAREVDPSDTKRLELYQKIETLLKDKGERIEPFSSTN